MTCSRMVWVDTRVCGCRNRRRIASIRGRFPTKIFLNWACSLGGNVLLSPRSAMVKSEKDSVKTKTKLEQLLVNI